MKKYIIVLALGATSLGAFAQDMHDLKSSTKEVETAIKETTHKVADAKVDEMTGKAAEAINVEQSKLEATTEMAADAIEAGTLDNVKAMAADKMTEVKAEKFEAINTASLSVDELKTAAADTEAVKEEKKANLLTKITDLSSKIISAESKLALLKESGASVDAIAEKAAIIANAKTTLATLTSSFN